jgi:hypothetical protein
MKGENQIIHRHYLGAYYLGAYAIINLFAKIVATTEF